jgi:hypothetical protein
MYGKEIDHQDDHPFDNITKVEVSASIKKSDYPDYTEGYKYEVDICFTCFEDKLKLFIEENSYDPYFTIDGEEFYY